MANPKTGLFLGTTPLFDVSDLNDQAQARELIIRLTQKINDVINVLNVADKGYYVQQQFVCGQVFFPNPALTTTSQQTPTFRQVFRLVVDIGILPNVGIKLVPHNIAPTALFTFTHIYATATDPIGLNYIPIPVAFVGGNIVSIAVDAVNVIIETNFNATNFTRCFAILEFLKN